MLSELQRDGIASWCARQQGVATTVTLYEGKTTQIIELQVNEVLAVSMVAIVEQIVSLSSERGWSGRLLAKTEGVELQSLPLRISHELAPLPAHLAGKEAAKSAGEAALAEALRAALAHVKEQSEVNISLVKAFGSSAQAMMEQSTLTVHALTQKLQLVEAERDKLQKSVPELIDLANTAQNDADKSREQMEQVSTMVKEVLGPNPIAKLKEWFPMPAIKPALGGTTKRKSNKTNE